MIAVYKLMCSVSDKARGLFKRRVFFSVGQTEKMFVVHFPNGGGKRGRVKARCVIKVKDIRMRAQVCVCVCVCRIYSQCGWRERSCHSALCEKGEGYESEREGVCVCVCVCVCVIRSMC